MNPRMGFKGPQGQPFDRTIAILSLTWLVLCFAIVVLVARSGHPWAAGFAALGGQYLDRWLHMILWSSHRE